MSQKDENEDRKNTRKHRDDKKRGDDRRMLEVLELRYMRFGVQEIMDDTRSSTTHRDDPCEGR